MYSKREELGANFEILRRNLVGSGPGVLEYVNRDDFENLRPVDEIPYPYQEIFSEFSHFNIIQSKVIDDALHTDDSLVVSAPTGGGKTTIFELAIVRLLISLEHTQFSTPFKIVYISPMKALCEERLVDWHKKFKNFGINAIAVTGDSENVELQNLLNHNLIITTPEKWDCLTRKWRENETFKLVKVIRLFMIDEIHLLNEEFRGSTLETIVCRMKTIEESNLGVRDDDKIRFVAVSATVPNIQDVAEWLGKNHKCHKFSSDYRPVKLNKIVLGYNSTISKSSPFKFDLSLNYKLQSLIMQYSHGKPTLIFCGTRKIVEMTAKHILHHLTINLKPDQKQCLVEAAATLSDAKVKEVLVHGVGYHHAGMLPQTRRVVENLFRNGDLPILVTTSTLAMGVNLPAHLVIIKSTKCYTNGGFRDYTETAISQMIGRAGRPQFDTEATALILTTMQDKEKFEKMIGGLQPIESDLHRHLIEHLNAEVVLQTITDLGVAMRWLSSTFLYIRARKNPRYYGLTSSDPSAIDRTLLEMCQIELNKLIKAGMLTIDQDILLKATSVGAAMAKYYLAFETMKLFTQIAGGEILQQILSLIAKCHEFSEMYLRVNDKKCLNLLNKCRNKQTIRFPLNGKIKTVDMKINCIVQAVLGCLDICDHAILTEALKIMRNGERIVKCLIEYLESKDKCFQALLNTIILAKCFVVKLWENSPFVSKQLPGIGNVMSSQLANAGKTTFQAIAESDAREIELIINKKPPVGNKILNQIRYLPKYVLKLELTSKNIIKVTIWLENAQDLEQTCTVNRHSLMYLLVGDADNDVLLYEKYSHSYLIQNPSVVRFINFQEKSPGSIEAHFISDDWVGIDCTTKFENGVAKDKGKGKKIVKKSQNDDLTYMQTFMDVYMKGRNNTETKLQNSISLRQGDDSENDAKDETNNSKIIIHGNVTIFGKTDNDGEENEAKTAAKRNVDSGIKRPLFSLQSTATEDGLHAHLERSAVSNPGPSAKKQFDDSIISALSSINDHPKQEGLPSNSQLDPSAIFDSQQLRNKFGFTPKRLSHSGGSQACDESVRSLNFEEKPKTQKISWRSPLTYSPAVKFSPKFPSTRSNMGENDRSFLSRVSSSSSTPQNLKAVNKTSSSILRSPSRSKIFFPLSDKAHKDSSLEERLEQREEILAKVGDIAATQFLESFGLISPLPKDGRMKSPNEYYHQLLTQTQKKEKDRETTELDNNEKKRKRDATFETDDSFGKRPDLGKSETQSPYFSNNDFGMKQAQDGPSKKVHVEKLSQSIAQKHSETSSDRKPSSSDCSDLRENLCAVTKATNLESDRFKCNRSFSRRLSSNDPFNDSKETLLMEFSIPSQMMQSDRRSQKSVSRRNSDYFDDFEDESFLCGLEEDAFFGCEMEMDDCSRKSLGRRNSDSFGEDVIDAAFEEATRQTEKKSYSRRNSGDGLAYIDERGRTPRNCSTFNDNLKYAFDEEQRRERDDRSFDRHRSHFFADRPQDMSMRSTYQPRFDNYQKSENVRSLSYQSQQLPPRCSQSEWYNEPLTSYRREPFYQPPSYTPRHLERPILPRNEHFDCYQSRKRQNDICDDGYRYIRQMMEKENDPPLYTAQNYTSYDSQSRRRVFPESSFANRAGPSRESFYDDRFEHEMSTRGFRTPLQERQGAYSHYYPVVERPERPCYYQQDPSLSYTNDKTYLMERFLGQMGKNDDRSSYYN